MPFTSLFPLAKAHAIKSLCAMLFDGGATAVPTALDFSILTLIFYCFLCRLFRVLFFAVFFVIFYNFLRVSHAFYAYVFAVFYACSLTF
jgi:hypothetical protein